MSLGRTDARFLLPRPPRTAAVLGGLTVWEEGLGQAGIRLVPAGHGAELVVATRELGAEAAAMCTDMAIVEGSVRAGSGLVRDRYLTLPNAQEPQLLVPLGRKGPARYALGSHAVPEVARKRLRNRLAAEGAARGLAPGRAIVSVLTRNAGPPFVVKAAGSLGIPLDAEWFLVPGQGDALSRGVFAIFPPASRTPAYALKFARVPGYADSFDRDERGLDLARRLGLFTARRAPRLLGRFEVADLHCSLETAAVGRRLFAVLRSQRSSPAKRRVIDRIAGWIVELGSATIDVPARLDAERARVLETVLPRWDVNPSPFASALTGVRPVAQHNDLGSWNIVVDDDLEFIAIDWEDALAHGFPLWDLWYFLADSLAHFDSIGPGERGPHFVRLFRGELPSSDVLFDWTRRAVEQLGIPGSVVGPLATLCWLHHGLSDRDRREASAARVPDSAQPPLSFDGLARLWLSEPGLGPGWNAWARPRV